MIPFRVAREHFASTWPEISAYADSHLREVGGRLNGSAVVPEPYFEMELQGRLRLYTARDSCGQLVGYLWVVLYTQPLEHNELRSLSLALFVAPSLRRMGLGRALVAFWESDMRATGILHLSIGHRAANDLSPQLEAIGYNRAEIVHEKVLSP